MGWEQPYHDTGRWIGVVVARMGWSEEGQGCVVCPCVCCALLCETLVGLHGCNLGRLPYMVGLGR